MTAPSPGPQPTIRFVNVDGVRLRTSIRGSGRPLLIITGIGTSLDVAEPFERRLVERGVQAISFDAPGVGQSTAYVVPRRMRGVAQTVERMLDALGYDQVDVLGVSLGGAIAQQLAREAPHRVRRLVLAATSPGLGGVPGSPLALLPLITPRRYYHPAYYRLIAGYVFGGAVRRDSGPLLRGSVAWLLNRPATEWGYLGQLYAIAGWTSLPWLWKLRQPTLVLAGDDDPIAPVLNALILACCIPDARLHIIRGGGHLFLLERPSEMARLVAEFVVAAVAPSCTHVSSSPPWAHEARPGRRTSRA